MEVKELPPVVLATPVPTAAAVPCDDNPDLMAIIDEPGVWQGSIKIPCFPLSFHIQQTHARGSLMESGTTKAMLCGCALVDGTIFDTLQISPDFSSMTRNNSNGDSYQYTLTSIDISAKTASYQVAGLMSGKTMAGTVLVDGHAHTRSMTLTAPQRFTCTLEKVA